MSKSKSKNFGVRVMAVPNLKPGAKWPTRAAWVDSKSKPDPADDKMADLSKAQEERARKKLIEMGIETVD